MNRQVLAGSTLGLAAALLVLSGLGLAGPAAAATTAPSSPATQPAAPTPPSGAMATPTTQGATPGMASGLSTYPGNPNTEPALVADEETRLAQVRTAGSTIRWRGLSVSGPYRLSTGSTYTLVLTKRTVAYGIADLLTLAPQTFVRSPDGSYLLSENIVVQPGATLALSAAGPLTIHLASDAQRFVSIVNMGGRLTTLGTTAAPVTITSWDRNTGNPDTSTQDGRAYVRSVGGQVDLEGTTFTDLGFWSGRTGGVALTGANLPSAGLLDQYGRQLKSAVGAQPPTTGATTPGTAPSAAPSAGATPSAPAKPVPGSTPPPVSGLLPAGTLPVPDTSLGDPSYSYVSARIENCHFESDAFGLYISSANGVDVSQSTIENSLVDGLVMHRFVVNAAVSRTTSQHNGGDGVVLARATTGIVLSEVTSTKNAGSGIVVRGGALATGPSATGMAVGAYGNNSITNSVASNNAHYGIEVAGGRNINVDANDVDGNDMGIVVRDAATDVSLVGNRLTGNARHAIALRDAVAQATVTGNVLSGGPSGIYVRDSSANISRNTMSGLTNHAVSLIGQTKGTVVEQNTFAGRGPSAVDAKRSTGAKVGVNLASGWVSTKPFWTVVRNALQPLTVMWVLLALVVLVTAVKGRRAAAIERRDPYQAQRRMAEIVNLPTGFTAPAGDNRTDPGHALVGAVGYRADQGPAGSWAHA